MGTGCIEKDCSVVSDAIVELQNICSVPFLTSLTSIGDVTPQLALAGSSRQLKPGLHGLQAKPRPRQFISRQGAGRLAGQGRSTLFNHHKSVILCSGGQHASPRNQA